MNLSPVELAVAQQVAVHLDGLIPSALAAGWETGATAVRIFPAQTMGAGYPKHLRGPLPDLQAVPSGGGGLVATCPWLRAGAVAVSLVGPPLGDALDGGDPRALRQQCRAVWQVVQEAMAG